MIKVCSPPSDRLRRIVFFETALVCAHLEKGLAEVVVSVKRTFVAANRRDYQALVRKHTA